MRFWDSSAIVPLLIEEPASRRARRIYATDIDIAAWWGAEVECVSALTRLEREGALDSRQLPEALGRLDDLAAAWREIQPLSRVRQTAIRLLRVHPLRAADSLQLAAAIAASEDHPETLPFITFDDRLGRAADREGFIVTNPLANA